MTDSPEVILLAALAIPDRAEREAFVLRACAGKPTLLNQVRALLDERDQAFPTLAAPGPTDSSTILETEKNTVGNYRLVAKLGEGGMGVVYQAEQVAPIRRLVALKIIKPGLDTAPIIARFESERQSLALMDHPSIAKVFEVGTTETGRPYFVMELVEGVSITRYAEQHALDVRQRLELFVEVCLAIQHAHTKGIIHRDVKPSNVLVTTIDGKPTPKVIDFGLAKALYQSPRDRGFETQIGAMIGTPEYVAPEQAALAGIDSDTRSDVYSLGVLLYQLLTGETPFARDESATSGLIDLLKRIVTEEPTTPSVFLMKSERTKLARLIRGELDWIVLKALEKDRNQRYQSAMDLALDVQRYLAGDPISVVPPSRWYRLRKFVARHRAAIVTAALVLLILICTTAVSTYLAIVADRDRRLVREMMSFLEEDVLGQPGPDLQARPMMPVNPEITVREAVKRAAKKLNDRFPDRPRVEVSLANTLGNSLREMGSTQEAEKVLQAALELARSKFGDDDPTTILTAYNLSWVYGRQYRFAALLELSEQLVPRAKRVLGDRHRLTLASQRGLGWVLLMLGHYARAEAILTPTLDQLREVCGRSSEETLDCMDALATCYRYQGKYKDAGKLLEEALRQYKSLGSEGRTFSLSTRMEQALLLACEGTFNEADARAKEVIDEMSELLSLDHPETRNAIRERAWILFRAGKFHLAMELLHKLVEAEPGKVDGESPVRSAMIWHLYGRLLLQQQRYAEAEIRLRVVRRVFVEYYAGQWQLDQVEGDLGMSLLGQNSFASAEPLLRQSYDGLQKRSHHLPAFEKPLLEQARDRLVTLYKSWGKPEAALEWQAGAAERE